MAIRSKKKKSSALSNGDGSVTTLDRAAGAMIGLGALDWGLVGLTNMEGFRTMLGKKGARAMHALVGASAAYAFIRGARMAKR